LRGFLDRIERQYGKARRIWVMDRGIPTEAVLEEMRGADPAVSYLVGTPKGRLSRLEQQLLAKPWHEARPGVQVKLLPQDGELYVFAQSIDRVAKERAMRRRRLRWLWARLKQLSQIQITRQAEKIRDAIFSCRQIARLVGRQERIDSARLDTDRPSLCPRPGDGRRQQPPGLL
jgi:hypothetical protein